MSERRRFESAAPHDTAAATYDLTAEQCTATSKTTGKRCRRPAMDGTTVCRHHGGAAPQVKAAAQRRLLEAQAKAAAAQIGLPVTVSPQQALLDEVHRCAGMVAFYGARVAEVDTEGLVWGRTREKTGGEDYGTTEEAKPNVWLALWNDERDRLARVSALAIKAGIEERRVQLAEAQGQVLAQVIRAVLEDMLQVALSAERADLERVWREQSVVIVPAKLRALTEGAA